MKARVVRKTEITKYKNEDWADSSRRVFCQGDTAYIPVKNGYPYDIELEERKPYRGIGYQKLSDTILIHGCTPTEEELSKILEWEKPSCILHIKSSCGVMRIPDAEVLYGTPHDVTFKESGILYTMNPAKVMFSQGNRNEKLRIRRCVSSHERVADMFAGIGYFTLSAAQNASSICAAEINPDSYKYLLKNIEQNHLKNVEAYLGDCRDMLSGVYDRILMGHFDAAEFLPDALAHSKEGTVLHIHGLGDRSLEIERAVSDAGYSCSLTKIKIKKYSADKIHYVWDAVLKVS